MVVRAPTVHASSLAYGVAVLNVKLDRLNTADREGLSLGAGAAETKGIFTF
jgi:hypothetical protein